MSSPLPNTPISAGQYARLAETAATGAAGLRRYILGLADAVLPETTEARRIATWKSLGCAVLLAGNLAGEGPVQ